MPRPGAIGQLAAGVGSSINALQLRRWLQQRHRRTLVQWARRDFNVPGRMGGGDQASSPSPVVYRLTAFLPRSTAPRPDDESCNVAMESEAVEDVATKVGPGLSGDVESFLSVCDWWSDRNR